METAIGVFASREHAERAVKELRERSVPEESIVFLTRSENEAKTIAKELGAYVGGFMGAPPVLPPASWLQPCFCPASGRYSL